MRYSLQTGHLENETITQSITDVAFTKFISTLEGIMVFTFVNDIDDYMGLEQLSTREDICVQIQTTLTH